MGYYSEEFLKKQEEDTICENLQFTDEELVEIYNALGYTSCTINLINGVLQNNALVTDIEESNRFRNSVRVKIGYELANRGCIN